MNTVLAALVLSFVIGHDIGIIEPLQIAIDSVSANNSLIRRLRFLHLLIQDIRSLCRWGRICTLRKASTARIKNLIKPDDLVLLLHLIELFVLS
jgi:hypothetical protein